MERSELACIAFVSSAMKDLTPDIIRQVTDEAGKINAQNGITGLTLFADGNVLVLLEGPVEALDKRFDELKKHPAHHSVIKILSVPISQRCFEDYPQALKILRPPQFKEIDDFQSPERKEYFEEFLTLNTPVSNAVSNFIKSNG